MGSASGGGISNTTGDSENPSLSIATDGSVYLAWHDGSSGNDEIYVRRWNGNAWEEVGEGSASGGGISNNEGDSRFPSLAIAGDGTLYVAWEDDSTGDAEIYVRRWNSNEWEEVGEGSASGGGISNNEGRSWYPSLANTLDGTPYVAWEDYSEGNAEIYLLRWNGVAWVEVGEGSASNGGVSKTEGNSWLPIVVIAPDDTPYIAWCDDSAGEQEIYVLYWDGSAWQDIGEGSGNGDRFDHPIRTQGSFGHSLAIAPDGTPYVAWANGDVGNVEMYILRWNGNEWEEVGVGSAQGGGVSRNEGDSRFPSLAFDPEGVPYLAWEDESPGILEIYIRRYEE